MIIAAIKEKRHNTIRYKSFGICISPLQKINKKVYAAPKEINPDQPQYLFFEWLFTVLQFLKIKIPGNHEEKRYSYSWNNLYQNKAQFWQCTLKRFCMYSNNK